MRCDMANAPAGSLLALVDGSTAKRGCKLVKQAAAFVGISKEEIAGICNSAKTVTGFDYRRRVRYIKYSSAARCPLLSAVIAAGGGGAPVQEIIPAGVYTVSMAAAALDMSRAAVRKLVKSGGIAGLCDPAGYLILGADLLRFASGSAAVLNAGRRGAIRSGRHVSV